MNSPTAPQMYSPLVLQGYISGSPFLPLANGKGERARNNISGLRDLPAIGPLQPSKWHTLFLRFRAVSVAMAAPPCRLPYFTPLAVLPDPPLPSHRATALWQCCCWKYWWVLRARTHPAVSNRCGAGGGWWWRHEVHGVGGLSIHGHGHKRVCSALVCSSSRIDSVLFCLSPCSRGGGMQHALTPL